MPADGNSAQQPSLPILRGGGAQLALEDLLLEAKIGNLAGAIQAILMKRIAAARASAEGLSVSDEQMEGLLGDFYADRDLLESDEVDRWLKQVGLREEQIVEHLRQERLVEQLRTQWISDEEVEKRFKSGLYDFLKVRVEVMRFDSKGVAAEVLLQLQEGELSWSDVKDKYRGVEYCEWTRAETPEEIAPELVGAPEGGHLGPIETDDGNYAIYRMLSKSNPCLDDELREQLRDALFSERLQQAFLKDPPRFVDSP